MKFVPLEKKFLFIIGVFNTFVCIVIPIALTYFRLNYENLKVDKLITRIPNSIKTEVIPHMEPFKREYFERFFKAAINVRELKYLKLSDADGNVLVEQRKGNVPDKYTQDFNYKLKSSKTGKNLGSVDLIITRDHIYEEIQGEFWQTFVAMVTWSLLVSLLVWYFFKLIIANPLNVMNEYLHKLNPGLTKFPKPLVLDRFKFKFFRRRDEIDVVADALSEAVKGTIERNIEERDRYKIIEREVVNRTEEVLEEKQKADQANEEKTEFIGHISHEIRNPINAISGFIEILDKEVNDPNEKELIIPLKAATNNLLGLVNDLLDISKAELGKLKIEPRIVDTKQVISNMKMMFEPKIKEKGLDLFIDIDPDFPRFLKTDGLRTAQIMQNLFTNAIKFTEKGFIKVTVKSKKLPIQNKETITILVEDTGIGVPLGEREKIFEKYRQMMGQSYQKYQGSGLGLSISRKIAKLLNGDLRVIDKEGPGTCFELVLKEVEVVDKQEEVKTLDDDEDIQFFDAKVLVVDDEKLNRDLVMWNLRPYNLKLYFAENGKEALNKAIINKPDIILMDLLMPKMDGIESIELIKVYENLKDIPIIVISAIINSENEERIKKLANGMMRKPILQKDLVTELAKFLPHKTVIKEKNTEEVEVVQLPPGSPIPPELEKILKEKYLPKIENLKDTMSIDEIKKFATELKELADKFACKTISTWSENMLNQTRNFNVAEIEKSFDNFGELLEEVPKKKAS
jgi:signal transduction histidine kinase/CheY-like chemotaxis protein